jgi:hypothetical protein
LLQFNRRSGSMDTFAMERTSTGLLIQFRRVPHNRNLLQMSQSPCCCAWRQRQSAHNHVWRTFWKFTNLFYHRRTNDSDLNKEFESNN